ncbi:MAG: steryl acetyl hydrolase, partial [Chitinophagaceae bacterium]
MQHFKLGRQNALNKYDIELQVDDRCRKNSRTFATELTGKLVIMKKQLLYSSLILILSLFTALHINAQDCGNRKLSPETQNFLQRIGYVDLTLEQLRTIPIEQIKYAGPPVKAYPKQDVERIKITADSIPVLVFNGGAGKNLPIIINYHGGGFIAPLIPALEYDLWHDSKTYEAVVFAVDYRVAPEHKFPAALNDSYEAFKWISENGKRFGGNTDKMILMGNSAGANLVAVITQKAREENRLQGVKLQVLNGIAADLTPVNMETSQSYRDNATGYFQTKAACYFAVENYAPGKTDDPEVSPLLTEDFSN